MHGTPLITTLVAGLGIAFILGAIAQRLRVSPLSPAPISMPRWKVSATTVRPSSLWASGRLRGAWWSRFSRAVKAALGAGAPPRKVRLSVRILFPDSTSDQGQHQQPSDSRQAGRPVPL